MQSMSNEFSAEKKYTIQQHIEDQAYSRCQKKKKQ